MPSFVTIRDEEDEAEELAEDEALVLERKAVISKYAKSRIKQEKVKALFNPVCGGDLLALVFTLCAILCFCGCGFMVFLKLKPAFRMEYTNCKESFSGEKCATVINNKQSVYNASGKSECLCTVHFTLKDKIPGPVGLFIEVSNFFQNHRPYAQSVDRKQLHGEVKKGKNFIPPNYRCKNFKKGVIKTRDSIVKNSSQDPNGNENKDKLYDYPCGALANSWFSDRFQMFRSHNYSILLENKGVAWKSDVKMLFKNPPNFKGKYNDRPSNFDQVFKRPYSWGPKTFEDWWNDGGMENEAFMNWMRVSSKSDTIKLFRVVKDSSSKSNCSLVEGLCAGNYSMEIEYNFDVKSFGGSKFFLLQTITNYGSKSEFLTWMFLVDGIIALLLAPIIYIILPTRMEIMMANDEILPNSQSPGNVDMTEQLMDPLVGETFGDNEIRKISSKHNNYNAEKMKNTKIV